LRDNGKKVAYTHFRHISPLPANSHELLQRYSKVIVAEQNNGQFADYLNGKYPDLNSICKYNKVEGQPFKVSEMVEAFTQMMEGK
jgi:2-oxoglutarate ferredoxin oxidoreductase subunit alpha